MPKANQQPAVYPIKGSKAWGCKVKLPDKSRIAVSLRVPWPNNINQAKGRAATLQREVDAKKLDAALEWLGEKSAETLKLRLGLKPIEDDAIRPIYADPTNWWEARSAWLTSYPTRTTVAGKIHDADFTRKGYESRTRIFCKWAEETGLAWKSKSATTTTILFLRDRVAGGTVASKAGVSKGSMDNDVRVLHTWFGWLHRKGWYDQMDKDAVYDDQAFAGEDDSQENFIPDWRLDLATLQKMHASRFDDDAAFMAWQLYVLVRGLGCRPKEAYTLSWDTVQIAEGVITFKHVKEAKLRAKQRGGRTRRAVKDRPVPIFFQWVHDALDEIRRLNGKRGTPVAVNTDGTYHHGSGQASNAFGRQLTRIGLKRPGYNLKACQRAGLMHLEQFLPPWVVARIAGHSLDIHMAHYSLNDAHMPLQKGRDYGRFDVPSHTGKLMIEKYRQPSLARELLDHGQL